MQIRNKTGMAAVTIAFIVFFLYYLAQQSRTDQDIDPRTDLMMQPGYQVVEAYCIGCHTANMITRRRATRREWLAIVRRMQEFDDNWKLPAGIENTIVDYLAKNYGH